MTIRRNQMNDDAWLAVVGDRLAEVRQSLDGEHMTIPVSEIFARDRRRRARHWLAGASACCVAIGLAVVLALAPAGGSARPGQAQLAAWTVRTNPDGTVTFTLRNTSHPARLQRALARAGVPAIVRWGEICQAGGPGDHHLLSTLGFVKVRARMAPRGITSYFALLGGSPAEPDLNWSWTVVPSRIPRDGEFVISAIPGSIPDTDIQAVWEFVYSNSTIVCGKLVKP
jgi:hypothetical protein